MHTLSKLHSGHIDGGYHDFVYDDDNNIVAKCYGGLGMAEAVANAERICHCVNNFDAVVKALKELYDTNIDSLLDKRGCTCSRCVHARRKAKKAIESATL